MNHNYCRISKDLIKGIGYIPEKVEEIKIVGDIRYSKKAAIIHESDNNTSSVNFLQELQKLMEEYGVVKIDVAFDAFDM